MPRLTVKAGVARERGARADADRHDDEVGGKLGPVVEQHGADARRAGFRVRAEDLLGVGLGVDLDAARLDRLLRAGSRRA